ncbi:MULTISPECIES: UDP-N-acetylmuramate dehydrogenase [Microbacterium]|uniref:UDP-N-acetylenolpyruvoylglucosamine reductase n=1 Tax=Microbacterium wangchenii TaxID=2541726 RepID=A0ABX5SU99_9MICO|nr:MULTISPECIES: UDP-N-acetylmuramate dehydrogenase [Microbacterium]MCK6067299.1 UDP-N-acetylmuramate dehydrogenase [Microbacterium sp. EYE_512]QBR89760.1 UDP-N-acetylmuramate dehydrogenase [Microbacterium wangchenii]TFV85381.1 UDP-N-acetylmuramate dehydrogenase [Microbacterium sp. dk485]TXK16642.1 UDP-N-acetylmuramate dehydrogenase [Microbacterium wangchenii]
MPELSPVPLAQLTTLRTGGAPHRLVEATTTDELIATLRSVWADGDPWLLVGGGSNLFVGDEPFPGTVVLVRTRGIERLPGSRPGTARLRVQAGHDWDELVAYTVAEGLGGVEALSGIPGTVGAAPVQNIGAYGQEIVQTLVEVELLDEHTGDVSVVPASELGLGFRTSVLKHHYGSVPARSAAILSVTFELEEVGDRARPIAGEQLRTALRLAPDAAVPLSYVRESVLAIRRSKGMVLDPGDPDTTSAGSFFQNAIVSDAFARTLPAECPRWPVSPDLDTVLVIPLAEFDGVVPALAAAAPEVKVSAAWLIEHSGLGKGFRLPRSRAGLSTKHTLALTNRGGASAEELAELARFVQQRVQSEFGLLLQPEPVLVNVEL